MAKHREPVNPFYVLLVVVGVVFLVTACAYGAMAYRAVSPTAAQEIHEHPLTDFLDRNGMALLGWELALLAAASFAAMGLDRYRDARRPAGGPAGPTSTEPGSEPGGPNR